MEMKSLSKHKLKIVFFIFILICVVITIVLVTYHLVDDSGPVIKLNSGLSLRGSKLKSRLSKEFYAFRGIRYGEAPVGELRFKAPISVQSSDGIFEATEPGPMCPQPFQPESVSSEDCLRLSVYTKQLPGTDSFIKKSVLVYIPGGAYYIGSGVSNHYSGPENLMDQDIVLVAVNYRLGSLGFLSLGTKEVPGNAGFKDQVLALKWIRDNISQFGGDPENVTLLGNSAGAMSIVLHMVSPMTQGLFHRVILMSGGISPQIRTESGDQLYLAQRQAKIMNCKSSEDVTDIYNCLLHVDAFEMANSLMSMFEFGVDNPIMLWSQVLETDFGQERFLIQDPYDLFRSGNFTKVPILLGITKDEMATSAVNIVRDETLLHKFDEEFDRLGPICLFYDRSGVRSKEISDAIWDAYNLSRPLTKDHLININHMFSDAAIGFSIDRVAKLAHNYVDMFYYLFSFQGRYSHLYWPDNEPYGVEHSDDLYYLFLKHTAKPFHPEDPEYLMVDLMTRLWTNFARTGNPNNEIDLMINKFVWPKYTTNSQYYLDITNTTPIVKLNLNEDRYEVWNNLYPF